jgi:O-antigen biosynthesis protein
MGREALTLGSCDDLARKLEEQSAVHFETAIWFYPPEKSDDDRLAEQLSRCATDVLLIPAPGTDDTERRPQLVECFRRFGFLPDYGCDLGELDPGAICLRQRPVVTWDAPVPTVEAAFSRLNARMAWLQRILRTRMAELEAADRHIARLEEKLLKVKQYRSEIKSLKEQKQALRSSPERRIGQVITAPYRLPQKLFCEVRKRLRLRSARREQSAASTEYQEWFQRHRASAGDVEQMRLEARAFAIQPLISVITPVFDTPVRALEEAVHSVLDQAYAKWELLLIDDVSTNPETLAALSVIAESDPRIRLIQRKERGGISAASNTGISQGRGEWLAIFDHDDILEPDALFHIVKVIQTYPNADLIYTDEDKLTEIGFETPSLKPDWSPDFFLSYNYICHLTALRREVFQQAGGFRTAYDGAQDYDLFLRVIEQTQCIHHVPRVLYHWRRSETSTADNIRRKPQALEAGRRAIEAHLERRGEKSHVVIDWNSHAYWVKREIGNAKRISIIILVRDRIDLLAPCIESLTAKTSYQNYEIVIVNNDSQSEEAREYFAKTQHRVLDFSGPFNFSALNNFAVGQTGSPWLLFLNNDVEVMEGEWLSLMAEHVQRPEVGAVGPRLLYPDNTVQHAGVVVGVGGIAEHAFKGWPGDVLGVCRQLQVIRNYSAVTGACLLTRRDVFDKVGGFDEARLPVAFNDVDLCLKIRRAGYLIVYTPFAKLYRYEAERVRTDTGAEAIFRERWADVLQRDPYYNPNLSRERADFTLGR